MTELRTAHTADLGAEEKAAIRSLMDAAFDRVSDDTFDNVLGGVVSCSVTGPSRRCGPSARRAARRASPTARAAARGRSRAAT